METFSKPQPVPMHNYDAARDYPDHTYQYASTGYTNSHDPGHMGQDHSFNNQVVDQYPSFISMHPVSGSPGTRVNIRISSPYALSSPFVSVLFGNLTCTAEVHREASDSTDTYLVSSEVPQGLPNNIPATVIISGNDGSEISRIPAGQFSLVSGLGASSSPQQGDDKDSKSPVSSQSGSPPKSVVTDVTTTSYDVQQANGIAYGSSAYSNGTSDMMASYRPSTFSGSSYSRNAPPILRPSMPGWHSYAQPLDGTNRTSPNMMRPAMTMTMAPSSMPNIPARLVRTSTIQGSNMNGSGYNSYSSYPQRVELKLEHPLKTMAEQWSPEEWANKRRIVQFRRTIVGSSIKTSFRPVAANDRSPQSVCVSCIWWAENQGCYITSVDTISLLEQLLVAPTRFSVEEKNRIRRNLEGFKPATVGKAKPDTEEFFKVIMGFSNPKPRNIEKDVKVFAWSALENALKKIISKYSVNPSASNSPPSGLGNVHGGMGTSHMVSSLSTTYQSLPSPPGATPTDSVPAAYTVHAAQSAHPEGISSPRSMSSGSGWGGYTTTPVPPRTLSPSLRGHQGLHNIPPLTTIDARPMANPGSYVSAIQAPPLQQQHAAVTATGALSDTQRWDASAAAAQYDAVVPGYRAPQHQVYGSTGYSDTTHH
ncbi:hypothetical protein BROUX41_000559 [Berkeleyomyces rouxiae]|uniref:uncharacterized protein n=1 Tax=Berkeleyomyces rouxiae TaxID=2035830 RepID=UPI003B7EAA8A